MEHQRTGLAGGFIGRARAIKQAFELRVLQRMIQAHAAFACGHGQPVAARTQISEQRQDTVKHTDIVLALEEVKTIAVGQLLIFFRWHIGGGSGQRWHQRHADHIGGLLITGHGAAHIAHRILNAATDDGRGVSQGTIPVKCEQIEAAWALFAIVFAMIFSSHAGF